MSVAEVGDILVRLRGQRFAEVAERIDWLSAGGLQAAPADESIGADFDEHLLGAMADAGGGHFYFIESAAQIVDRQGPGW